MESFNKNGKQKNKGEYMKRLKKYYKWAVSWIPTSLPNSLESHERWASDILELGNYPDNASFRNAIATMLLHLNADTHFKSKQHFIRSIRRGIVNEIAWSLSATYKEAQNGLKDATKEVV